MKGYVSSEEDEAHSDEEDVLALAYQSELMNKQDMLERRQHLLSAHNQSVRGSFRGFRGSFAFPRVPSSDKTKQDRQSDDDIAAATKQPCTNIFSVYADPENRHTWHKYHLDRAALVVWCSIDRAPDRMCDYFSEKKVPFITISNSNQEAKALYEARCTYVVQQEYLAANEFSLMLKEELDRFGDDKPDASFFKQRNENHQDQIDQAFGDPIRRGIHQFI